MSFPPPPIMSPSARTGSTVGGLQSGGGSVTMDQVQALLTATIQQMGGTLADALKNSRGKENQEFTSGVKVEVQCLKDDHPAKVLEHIQLVFLMATLRGFRHAFDALIAFNLPAKHSDKEG